jgi:TonB family protein
MRYYPQKAVRAHIPGSVVLECKALASGVLTSCKVIAEVPAGYDFGDAGLKMTCLFKMKPTDPATTPAEGRTVRVPLQFKLPDGY